MILDGLIQEETAPYTRIGRFYPARLGQVLNGRYQITLKLGYGGRSTVWLARDLGTWRWQRARFVAIKIVATTGQSNKEVTEQELDIMRKMSSANPQHPGYQNVAHLLDPFFVPGSVEDHLALVSEPLREPLMMLRRTFDRGLLPKMVTNIVAPLLLHALDYLHTECHVIHGDISEMNVLFRFASKHRNKLLNELSRTEYKDPSPVKKLPDRTIQVPRNDFGPMAGHTAGCVLTDFDSAVPGDIDGIWNHDIQPTGMTAPEVLLRAGWTYSADIWNLGVLLCELVEGKAIFDDSQRENWQDFSEPLSFARMVAFLGPPPSELLDRAERLSAFYKEDRTFKYPELVEEGCSFERFFTRVVGEEKGKLIAFVKRMLTWLPEERATAKALLQDGW